MTQSLPVLPTGITTAEGWSEAGASKNPNSQFLLLLMMAFYPLLWWGVWIMWLPAYRGYADPFQLSFAIVITLIMFSLTLGTLGLMFGPGQLWRCNIIGYYRSDRFNAEDGTVVTSLVYRRAEVFNPPNSITVEVRRPLGGWFHRPELRLYRNGILQVERFKISKYSRTSDTVTVVDELGYRFSMSVAEALVLFDELVRKQSHTMSLSSVFRWKVAQARLVDKQQVDIDRTKALETAVRDTYLAMRRTKRFIRSREAAQLADWIMQSMRDRLTTHGSTEQQWWETECRRQDGGTVTPSSENPSSV